MIHLPSPEWGRAVPQKEELPMTKTNNRARKAGQGSKWIRRSTRLAIYHRDGFRCAYCLRTAEEKGVGLTLDHLVACEAGGTNEPANLVTCCLSCNSAKQDKTMRSWFAYLRANGVNTEGVGPRIRRLVARKLDRREGRRLSALRRAH